MTHENCRKATKKAIEIAKEAGAVISFDPNLREPLWDTLDEAKEQVVYGIGMCDILKISDNEINRKIRLKPQEPGIPSVPGFCTM